MPDDRADERFDDLVDLEHVEALLRELGPDDLEPTDPPPSVWAGIQRELAGAPAGADGATPAPAADVVPLASRRRPAPTYLAAAAAVVLLVVGAVAVLARGDGDTIVATAQLAFDPAEFDPLGAEATATAHLVAVDDGYAIELDDASFPQIDGDDLELWLIEADDRGEIVEVVAIAVLDGSDRYAVPEGLDVSTHTIVDISIEPRDGDEAHSGRSILRGQLPSA